MFYKYNMSNNIYFGKVYRYYDILMLFINMHIDAHSAGESLIRVAS